MACFRDLLVPGGYLLNFIKTEGATVDSALKQLKY
jgi:hypothetical protein